MARDTKVSVKQVNSQTTQIANSARDTNVTFKQTKEKNSARDTNVTVKQTKEQTAREILM